MFKLLADYRAVYGFLWRTYGSYWQVRLSFLIRLISQLAYLVAIPIATSMLVSYLSKGNYDAAIWALILFLAMYFSIDILSPLATWIGLRGENKAYAKLTGDYFNMLIRFDMNYFNSNMAGDLTTAVRQFADSCMILVRTLRQVYMSSILSILLPVIVILFYDWKLGLIVLCLSIVQTIYIAWSSKVVTKYREEARKLYRKHSGVMSDAISNVLAIRSAAQEDSTVDQIRKNANDENVPYFKRYTVQAKVSVSRELLLTTFLTILLGTTIWRITNGAINLATVVLVITYAPLIMNGILRLNENVQEHDDYVDKILSGLEIQNYQNKILDPEKPTLFDNIRGRIELNNVDFTYQEKDGGTEVFHNLNLTIPRGQHLGVVGLSGAGKSTLAKLILRFDDVASGQVLIDEHDVRDIRQTDLHRQIAYVPQEPLLLHSSIRENVILAKPNATDDEVWQVLKRAHASEFVEKLAHGLDSIVGERGVKLSGGQKQRIAIARALIQDAPIMILDEATSALDSESEQIIKNSFHDILRSRTAVVVAHRLSTLSEMDRIIVIDDGRIVEDGTHIQLVHRDGLYARLWRRQQEGLATE